MNPSVSCGVRRWRAGSGRARALDLLAGRARAGQVRAHLLALHRSHALAAKGVHSIQSDPNTYNQYS
jgi:hypothetical protein